MRLAPLLPALALGLCCALAAGPALALPLPAPAAPDGRWYAVQLHAHSRYSDGFFPLGDLVRWAKQGGLDALADTEHNTDQQFKDPAYTSPDPELLLIPSFEWTSGYHNHDPEREHAHASVWGLKPGEPPLDASLPRDEMIAQAHARGMLVGINHPYEPRFPWPDPSFAGADAVEVWQWAYGVEAGPEQSGPELLRQHNSWGDFFMRNSRALAGWQQALRRGQRLTPVAVADFHVVGGQLLESPCTLVWAKERSVSAILAGLKAGHVALAEGARAARVELWADGDGDGTFEALAGDSVPVGAALQVRTFRAKGLTLSVYDADGLVQEHAVGSDEESLLLPASKAGFYWARLDQRGWTNPLKLNPLKGMTGALFVGGR